MGKILEAFLTDQLQVDVVTEQRTPEHQRLCDKSRALQEKLNAKLDAEDKDMLAELVDTLFSEGCVDAQKKFERGYRLGVLMASEIFTEQDMFLTWPVDRPCRSKEQLRTEGKKE